MHAATRARPAPALPACRWPALLRSCVSSLLSCLLSCLLLPGASADAGADAGAGATATPVLDVAPGRLDLGGARVHPNLLLNLSLTYADAGAAYRDDYQRTLEYGGYFNARMCYSYPEQHGPDADADADAGRGAWFSIDGAADALHECAPGRATFSGNFLNWASSATLDLVRLALTGGDRVVDEAGLTVLQRAWLPDRALHPLFYAGDGHFQPRLVSGGGAGSAPGSVTPFEADTLQVVSCDNRIVFYAVDKGAAKGGGKAGGKGAGCEAEAPGRILGQFKVRVKVCSEADAASRPELCRRYAAGFKPEGSLQRHHATLRIGVMSYRTGPGANQAGAYGGVLRAPLKYIGPTAFDAAGHGPRPNERAEWDAHSGVLARDPDRAAGGASGAVNYINQLGRSDPARPGAYSHADPGAELYYESLRYLQGRGPSPMAAGAGGDIAAAGDARFPVWNVRPDPVTAACQRNVVATVGHASFAGDRYLPGNTRIAGGDGARGPDGFAPSPFDVMQAVRRVGEMEADSGGAYANPAPRPDLRGLEAMDDGPGGAGSFYLAGAAWWAHTHPIRADKPVRIDSYAAELGMPARPGASALYLGAKYGAFEDRNGDANPFRTSAARAFDSEWSADGATPFAWFGAADPHRIGAALRGVVDGALARPGRVPGPAVAMAGRPGAAPSIIEASHDPLTWSGRLARLAVPAAGAIAVGAAPLWDAARLLDGNVHADPPLAPRPAPHERKIYTLAYQADLSSATVAFTWDSLGLEQRGYLDLAPDTGMKDGLGRARTAFLRGERTLEAGRPGGLFRRRAGVLGDAMRSTPLVVGAPSASSAGEAYGRFHAAYKNRRSAIYLGANDGMLHAFDAADGAELFAYVPNALVPALNQLASPSYRHRAYVDASAGQGEATIGGRWRSVLVSGMGMGARGVFALDISDPAAFESGLGALWEFTDADDAAMGHVSAPPQVARLRTGSRGALPEYRHFAVVSSGVNNYGPGAAGRHAGGALFLLALDKPPSQRWRRGVNYYRIDTPLSDARLANALSAPALALGADASVRFAYAGDLQGQLWRFDFTGNAPWPNALGPAAARPRPLYAARDAAGSRQPIAHAPRVVFAPGGGYLVLFGTGKLLEAADLQPPLFAQQSFYAIHDSLERPLAPVGGRADLAPRILAAGAGYAISGARFSLQGPGARKGWYFDFPQARSDGERVAGSAVLAAGTLLVDSFVPGADPCAAPLGRSYVLDSLSGLAFGPAGVAESGAVSGEPARSAALAAPMLFEAGASVGPRSATGLAGATRTLAVVRMQAEGTAPSVQQIKLSLPARRIGWREVANWGQLHQASKK